MGRGGRPPWKTKLEGIRDVRSALYVFKICRQREGGRWEVLDTISRTDSWLFRGRNKTFRHDEIAPAHGWNLRRARERSWRGAAEWEKLGYSKSQPQESKFDFRAIVGQQFFFFFSSSSRASFSFSLPLLFRPLPHLRYRQRGGEEQLGQKLRKLVKGRICWKSGYCEWQLAVHYSWITATPGWRTGREEDREGGRRRKNGRVYMEGGKKKRAKETRWMEVEVRERELPSENIENRAYHSQQNSDCFSWDCH